MNVRIDPTRHDGQAPEIVIDRRSLRIDRHDLRVFGNNARLRQNVAATIEQSVCRDDYLSLLLWCRFGLVVRGSAQGESA